MAKPEAEFDRKAENSTSIYINYLPFKNISFDILSKNYYNYIFGLMVKFGLPVY